LFKYSIDNLNIALHTSARRPGVEAELRAEETKGDEALVPSRSKAVMVVESRQARLGARQVESLDDAEDRQGGAVPRIPRGGRPPAGRIGG